MRLLLFLASLGSVLGPSSDGHAQQFDLNQFRASETTQDGFAVSTARDQGHLRFGAQLYLDYSDDPLLFAGSKVVSQQLTGELIAALGLWDRLVVFAGLRYHFMLRGNASGVPLGPLQAVVATGSGLGDLQIGARVRAWGEKKDLVQIAAQGAFYVHTASMADGDQNYRGGPTDSPRLGGNIELLATFNLSDEVHLSTNLGYVFRKDVVLPPDLNVGDAFTFGLGAIWELLDDRLALIAEFSGSTGFGSRQKTPLEVLAGAKYHHKVGFTAGLGGGAGMYRGIGAPDYRLLGMLGYAMPERVRPPRVKDRDEDGLPDGDDRCPKDPEDFDGFEDDDGCPESDNDQDGILDANDGAPNEAEDRDDFEDEDGIPDYDNDGDGILDADDRCANEPGVAVTKGCPDPDTDGDGVPDRVDNCPNEAGLRVNMGCLKPQLVEIHYDHLGISKKVYFGTGKSRIQKRSNDLLDNIAAVLQAHPEILLVEVEGHADPRGSEEFNLKLSHRRAVAVVTYLVKKGIAGDRLIAKERGEAAPARPDAVTDLEHEANRRVQFRIFARTTGQVEQVEDPARQEAY
jgi:outer membrane protein OmpA-like peptidoglycan-associated protein